MSKAKQMLYTKEGLKELTDELSYLKNTKRKENLEAIAVAKSFGDLSENAEYDAARNEQAQIEAKIKELEEMIANAVVVDEDAIDAGVVSMGSHVKVIIESTGAEKEYSIVAPNQVAPMQGLISDQSPVGKALIGARAGDEVSFEVPSGAVRMKVVEVSRSKS
ncbi:MAG: transcription elongation factor GreA [Clostridia bacterium]|nr:transcription elongation factor GreA [Clostridia bacterium]MBR6603195.1 transcription elongation factor GreA [Clostridia bacterium]